MNIGGNEMFLNKTILKKFIKSSFKWEGLTVGRIYDGLVVAGGRWITWTEDGYIPNWIKAAVMEYTGELPKQGCVFKAKKDEPIQYEIAENNLYDLPEMKRKCIFTYTVTPVVVDSKHSSIRIIQQDSTLNTLAVPEKYYDMIDLSELGEENAPAGPSSMDKNGSILIYKNEHSAYAFTTMDGVDDITRKVMEHMDSINFSEEGF